MNLLARPHSSGRQTSLWRESPGVLDDDSDQVFSFIEQEQIQGYVSASTFSDLYYLIRKQRGRDWALNFLTRLSSICQVATVDQAIISMALTTNFKDFEDAIVYGVGLLNHLDAIITRNPGDFPVTNPRIMTPQQLIQKITNPESITP